MSINALSRITGLDRATVVKYLEDQGLDPTETSTSKTYDFLSAIRAFIFCSKGQSSADRRNDAQAHKSEVETQILLSKYIPIEEAAEVHRVLFSDLNRRIQALQIDDATKEEIVAAIHGAENSQDIPQA